MYVETSFSKLTPREIKCEMFHPYMEKISRLSLIGITLAAIAFLFLSQLFKETNYESRRPLPKPQSLTSKHVFTDSPTTIGISTKSSAVNITQIKILILAYPRSGSSLTGEVLSAAPKAGYIYEPLHQVAPFGKPVDFLPSWNVSVKAFVQDYIEGLFHCNEEYISKLAQQFIKRLKNLDNCDKANPFVIKTIRLHWTNLEPWISHPKSDIKIVHLVRDPRGIYNSMSKRQKIWAGGLNNIQGMCHRMLNDSKLANLKSNYFMLHYEKLVTQPDETLRELYRHLEMPFDNHAKQSLLVHTGVKNGTVNGTLAKTGYFSTFREADHDVNKWKKQLPVDLVHRVESACSDFMEIAGYPIHSKEKNDGHTTKQL